MNKSVMKKMVTVLNFENGASNEDSTAEQDANGRKKPRSGKELWAIARKLTYEKTLATKRTNSMMQVVRAEKIRRQQELKEKQEQMQLEEKLLRQ